MGTWHVEAGAGAAPEVYLREQAEEAKGHSSCRISGAQGASHRSGGVLRYPRTLLISSTAWTRRSAPGTSGNFS